VSDLYDRFRTIVAQPWKPDHAAYERLRDAQNEIVHRMVEAVV